MLSRGLLFYILQLSVLSIMGQQLYTSPDSGTQTRWISPENLTGAKGQGGKANKGAKGNAFFIVQPGETKVLMDVKGAGIIQRMWMSGTIGTSQEQRRAVRLDIFWDGTSKPAVSCPIGDFFGMAHGLLTKFENGLFQSPEGRSFNFTIPMPFRKSALMTITNESRSEVWIWYDINYLQMKSIPSEALYFHAYWKRDSKTEIGKDYVLLPKISGKGRFIGSNIGVIGDSIYRGTWFGEGEIKVYLDGDHEFPTLVGTGTEDYIGTGWGQGEYAGRYFGSLVSNNKVDVYAFYRYHLSDAVYFHQDCRVTLQQIGSGSVDVLRKLNQKGANINPIWYIGNDGKKSYHMRLLERADSTRVEDADFPINVYPNFYRSDDVCSTTYFYLDSPLNDLPALQPVSIRLAQLKEMDLGKVNEIRPNYVSIFY